MWLIPSSQSAPESVDSISDSAQGCERLAEILERVAWSRGRPLRSRYWLARCKKGGWTTVLSGLATCETYPPSNFRPSTGLQEDIPASRLAPLESEWEKTTRVICGPLFSTSLGLFDLEESSSRTSPDISRSASVVSFGTWRDAVTAARSDCSQRRKSARPTEGSESLSSAWPTPTTAEAGKISCRPNYGQQGLSNHPELVGKQNREKMTKTRSGDVGPRDQVKSNTDGNLPGLLNAGWVEALMGFPPDWTDFEH